MSKRKKSLKKSINPIYYIFCEGNTEKEYIGFLKQNYRRIPIEIKPKIEGNRITQNKINNHLRNGATSPKDKIFLLYDIDVEGILEKLNAIRGVILLVSNPCIELWFLLHYKQQTADINTSNCIKDLSKIWSNYNKKSYLTSKRKDELLEKQNEALKRAERLTPNSNPSTTIIELIKTLENAYNEKIKQV